LHAQLIGSGRWAGKSAVAGIGVERFGLTHYRDACGHQDRRLAQASHAVRKVRRHSVRVIGVGGTAAPETVAETMSAHWSPFLG